MRFFYKVAVCIALATSLAACNSTPAAPESAREQNVLLLENASEVYVEWKNKLKDIESLRLYSPSRLQVLESLWQRVENTVKEFEDNPERLHATSFFGSETYYSRFQKDIVDMEGVYEALLDTQRAADIALRDAALHLNYLQGIESREYFRSEYDRLARMYERLYVVFDEQGESRAVTLQDEFLLRANSLEVKTIKRIYVTPLENVSRELRRRDARTFVTVSFAKVDVALAKAKSIIDVRPRDFTAINNAVDEISFELAHSTHMLEAVLALRALHRDDYEAYILDMEQYLLSLSLSVNGKDYRDHTLPEQVSAILNDIAVQKAQIDALQRELDLLKSSK